MMTSFTAGNGARSNKTRPIHYRFAAAAFTVIFAATLCAGEVIDRLVEVVDQHPILQSELDDQVRYESLMEGRPLDKVTVGDRQNSLTRLTDQWLIRRQMDLEKFSGAGPEAIASAVKEARAQIPGAAADAGWNRLLAGYGLTSDDITAHIATQIDTLRFIDLRFRPTVKIDAASVNEYYQLNVVALAKKNGNQPPPLPKVSASIEKILTEKQIDTMLASWLQSLRLQSRVELVESTPRGRP